MLMNTFERWNEKKVYLKRLHTKLGEIVTWEVLSEDKKIRIGIVRQMNDQYLTKRVGWQLFKVKYWLGSKFYPQAIIAGKTRREVIIKLVEE